MEQPVFDEKTIKEALSILQRREEVFFDTMSEHINSLGEDISPVKAQVYEAMKLVISDYSSSCQKTLNNMLRFTDEQSADKNQMTIDEFLQ